MTTDEITRLEDDLARLRADRVAAYAAKLERKDRIFITKMRLKHCDPVPQRKVTSERQRIINMMNLDSEHVEMVSKIERPPEEIGEFIDLHADTVSRRLRQGMYQPGPSDSKAKRMIDTLSVAKTLYAATDQEQEWNLDAFDRP